MNRSPAPRILWILLAIPVFAQAIPPAAPAPPTTQPLLEVPSISAEAPFDTLIVGSSEQNQAAMTAHQLTAAGKPARGNDLGIWGQSRCQWIMPTPQPGQYVVSLSLISGEKRPGRFGYRQGNTEHISPEIRRPGDWTGCLKAFRIDVPEGQTQTRLFITGDGIYFCRADISRVTRASEHLDGKISTLAESSYRTLIRRPEGARRLPPCVILAPAEGIEGDLARQLAVTLGIPVLPEPGLKNPFPAAPAIDGATPDTNLILLSAGVGGPLTQALRRAELVAEDRVIPGPGGYVIRTIPRPFAGKANLIVISAGDRAGLERGIKAFNPQEDPATHELIHDQFLIDSPGERWAKLRPWPHTAGDQDPVWAKLRKEIEATSGAGKDKSNVPSREFIRTTHQCARRYWLTGNPRWAELTKLRLEKMMEHDVDGVETWMDAHMELYGLIRGWDRVEESAIFSAEDRRRITNYLLTRCVEGREGFARAYLYFHEFSGPVRMRHNHQTVLGSGLMQAGLYFGRLYGLGRAQIWKSWCDDIIENATYWGHAPENSPNYEPRTFMEVADMLHAQGLSTKGPEGTRHWPAAAARFLAIRDSFGLPASYGDCWDGSESESLKFFEIMRDDWNWPAAQFAIDHAIRGFRYLEPESDVAEPLYAYLHGSTEVGGALPSSDDKLPAFVEAIKPLTGLAALPMTEGYWRYMTGQVGNTDFWNKHGRPQLIPYERTADKIVYRGSWEPKGEYLLLETIGWANHGHMDLGTIVQYCQGGRLWIVDCGYENTGPEHHSTLEIKRDGQPAWGKYPDQKGRWGDFRAGPQMFEVLEASSPGNRLTGPLPFTIKCQAKKMAGATWTRALSGGVGQPLTIEDTLTAQEPGEYELVFRLRLLGTIRGENANWTVDQEGASLPITLTLADGDRVATAKWKPDPEAFHGGAYPQIPFLDKGGIPNLFEWRRTIRLRAGETTIIKATLGPGR